METSVVIAARTLKFEQPTLTVAAIMAKLGISIDKGYFNKVINGARHSELPMCGVTQSKCIEDGARIGCANRPKVTPDKAAKQAAKELRLAQAAVNAFGEVPARVEVSPIPETESVEDCADFIPSVIEASDNATEAELESGLPIRRKLKPEDREYIVERAAKGTPRKALASEFGVTRQMIEKILKAAKAAEAEAVKAAKAENSEIPEFDQQAAA